MTQETEHWRKYIYRNKPLKDRQPVCGNKNWTTCIIGFEGSYGESLVAETITCKTCRKIFIKELKKNEPRTP